MIVVPSGVRVLVATKPVDFRKGIGGLAALVQEQLRLDPYAGTVFVSTFWRMTSTKAAIFSSVTLPSGRISATARSKAV